MNCGAKQPSLIQELRQKLAGVVRELDNPRLLNYTRRQLEARERRLRQEIQDLTHPTPFREDGELLAPTPHRGGYEKRSFWL